MRAFDLLRENEIYDTLMHLQGDKMSEPQKDVKTSSENANFASNDEKNLVVSFIQFVKLKASSKQCTEEQLETIEGGTG